LGESVMRRATRGGGALLPCFTLMESDMSLHALLAYLLLLVVPFTFITIWDRRAARVPGSRRARG